MDDGAGHLRRKDTTKGAPLRILSLDGGGVRGYSMLIILQELMHRTFVETEGRAPQRHEIPKPCDHFDLIAGSGTGGLIAIMLGRLRLDLDTCKDLYVRMTRRVFETDKTFAGIPLKGTMFKASKLEEVIKEVVKEHTVYESEGNDALGDAANRRSSMSRNPGPQRTMSQSSRYSSMGQTPVASHGGGFSSAPWRFGNPDALLYDQRDTRTKTALTAVLQGTTRTEFLRSYDSRKEPAPDVNCTIWQAGRATSAAQMAFKPVRIGQSSYLDEGSGKYNPSPEVLDEATINEWPGREVGVFVSIGTGKRPKNTNKKDHEWWEGFLGGTMVGFAEARRKMIMKLEGCETTHEYMLQQHLKMRNVNTENYYRFNVEVGVGEFGMNEWSRLSQISTNTRIYLSKAEVEGMTQGAAAKMARSHFAKIRQFRPGSSKELGASPLRNSWQSGAEWTSAPPIPPPSNPLAVELPGDMTMMPPPSHYHNQRPSLADSKFTMSSDDGYSGSPMQQGYPSRTASEHSMHQETLSPYQHHLHGGSSPQNSSEYYQTSSSPPPPRPPKAAGLTSAPTYYADNMTMSPTSPISTNHTDVYDYGGLRTFVNMGDPGRRLPYPDQKFADVDGPPPSVNMQSKPQM